jgi:hypothetical protein
VCTSPVCCVLVTVTDTLAAMSGQPNIDRDIYDDEAFIGTEEGEIMDGTVAADLDDEGASRAPSAPCWKLVQQIAAPWCTIRWMIHLCLRF